MRDPSLHITKSDLVRVMNLFNYGEFTPEQVADKVMSLAKPYQITDRYTKLLALKKETASKVSRSLEANLDMPSDGVEKFNMLLTAERQKGYAKVRVIRKSDSEYTHLKEVAARAYRFAHHFDVVPLTDGVKEFIRIGLDCMGKYSLNRFRTYEKSIYEIFESQVDVIQDAHPEITASVFHAWKAKMQSLGADEGMVNIQSVYKKYVHFVYAAKDVIKNDADVIEWVDAQFEELAFLEVVPELAQFYGENAAKRWSKYRLRYDTKETTVTDIYGND